MFGHLLGLGSFDSPERPLAHKQTSLPITFGGIKFILTSTIAPTTYLRSWALVVLIIIAKFIVNWRPFLLKALTRVDNNTFLFQQHISFLATLQGNMWFSTTPSSCVFSSIWTTHWATNDSNLRFHFGAFAPSYPFQHVFRWDIWSPLCLNFIMILLKGQNLAYNSISFLNFSIIFPSFL